MNDKGKIVIPTEDTKVVDDTNDVKLKSTSKDDIKGGNDDTPPDVDDTTDTSVDTVIKVDDVEYKLDDKGNALNEDGTVFKTKDELDILDGDGADDADNEPTEVEVDEDGVITKYKLDKNGNAINDKGEIVYKAEDLVDDAGSDGVGINDFIKEVNIPIIDSDGNPVEYEDTPEGRAKYVQDVYARGQQDGTQAWNEQLFNRHPILQNVINHLESGGKLDDFKPQPDYSSVKLDKKDEAQLRKFAIEAYVEQGMSVDKANKYFDYIKSTDTDGDEIYKEAKAGLDYLKEKQEEFNTQQQEQIDQQKQKELEEINEYWGITVNEKGQLVDLGVKNSIYDIVKNKTITLGDDTYKIPEKIKVVENGKPVMRTVNDFLKYMYEPIIVNTPDGRRVQTTRDNLKIQEEDAKRTTNHDVFDAYRRFVGYDDTQLINEKVKSEEVKRVKRLVVKNKKGTSTKADKTIKRKIKIDTSK